ncbi:TonB-dependent receptor plug domain-containing protein [Chitinophaga sp. SYP-B3965]|uniref:TonB-dependent receptor n=1 Tax=Chitinophaga sp. SYP-B3965 TaxID=2663120 RepID=UPI001299EAC1|nr:carboxypeptidase regulatory-like domain-containing protein [Chitinophaga sp. SYP-B3965]MRG43633.1 TonB-dependent receptor plug domain-containing protein [Chitinophaga sp. SYP-B3965]
MGFRKLLTLCLLVLGVNISFAQVTTSSLNGSIKDKDGQGLPGATVKATHLPTGSIYGTTTQPDGRYTIPNMRAGGPYKIEVTFIGYAPQTFNDVNLQLGVSRKLDAVLEAGSQQLKEVNISGQRGGIINPNNSGTAVSVSRQQIENLPSVNRSMQDFARLSTQANSYSNGGDGSPLGISFGGQNNRYNQFAIDGAMANDVFGLAASGTNGGQAGGNPISIEAIDQFQIVLNPYDVKQSGFAGGGINAITKSGANEFHGAAYYYMQNESFVGKSPNAAKAKYGKFNNDIYGIGIGGPIIKNKLFFYLNAERTKRKSPVDFNPEDPSTGATTFTVADLKSVSDYVSTNFGVDLGGYTNQQKEKESTTFLGRIDWNINSVHKLTLRHSYVDASDIGGTSRSRDVAYFYNNYYKFPSKTHSTTLELNSLFSNKISNELRIGLNIVRDNRQYQGDPFPAVRINVSNGSYNLGAEFSSQVNALKQNIITLTDNVTLYRGKHTITIGTSNDFYNMKNDFMQNAFGNYTFGSLADFLGNAKPTGYQITYTTNDSLAKDGVKFSAMQLSLYGQDEWNVTDNFRLTYGLRVDMPVFPTKPQENPAFATDFPGYSTATLPKTRLLWSPRIGFNWDVRNNAQTQIRGGVGIFTSRLPFVWISNQYNNTGNLYTSVNLSAAAQVPAALRLRYDKNDPFLGQYSAKNIAALGGTITARPTNINLTDKDFKFPQVFKTNLALDQQLPWGVVGTLEANYSRTLNNVIWTNLNTVPSGSTMTLGGKETRPTWVPKTIASGNSYDQVLLLGNTNKGYTYNLSAEFTKSTRNGLFAKIGYSFGESYSLNDGTSSTAGSNWRFPPNTDGLNDLDIGYSKYRMGHRVLGVISQTFKYGKDKKFATTVSLFYNGQSGTPYSWVYFNTVDPTGDDKGSSGNNDQLYIPTAAEVTTMRFDPITKGTGPSAVIITEAQQRIDFEELITNDKYLSAHRGSRAEKYAVRTPFEHVFDFKLAQTIPIIKNHKVELTFDIMNVGNLISNKAGRTYFISNNVATPITFRSNNAGGPFFQYDETRLNDTDGKFTPYFTNNFTSRWRGQLGIRYSF